MSWYSCSECWVLSQHFHSTLSLFIKRFFNSSSLSDIREVSSTYLRLLVFLPTILIQACVSSSPAFHMMYSAYKLNKQGENIQPWHTAFPIWSWSIVPCRVLTAASRPAHRFLRRQVRWPGIPISLKISHSLLQPHVLQPARVLCPWNFPGKNTGVGSHFLLKGIFPT